MTALTSPVCGQVPSLLPADPTKPANPAPSTLAPQPGETPADALPNAPSATARSTDVVAAARSALHADSSSSAETGLEAEMGHSVPVWETPSNPGFYSRMLARRSRILSPYQRFLNSEVAIPMSAGDKAFMAGTDVIDPGNLTTLALGSAIFVANNSYSALGPGMRGFGLSLGYSISQDVTAEFLGTFLIPSLAHQDPRYFRLPHASIPRRILHAVSHTVVTRSDSGAPMPNYATFLTYPALAEISNGYVPGLQRDAKSTAARILTSIALDPSEALLGEFLPDISKRIHIRILFFQQIINNINLQAGAGPGVP